MDESDNFYPMTRRCMRTGVQVTAIELMRRVFATKYLQSQCAHFAQNSLAPNTFCRPTILACDIRHEYTPI